MTESNKEQIAFIKDCLIAMNKGNFEELKEISLSTLERLNLQLLQSDVSGLLIAWEQYKKSNWWESQSVDVEKILIDRFKSIYCH